MFLLKAILRSFKKRGIINTIIWGCSEFYFDFLFGIQTVKLRIQKSDFKDEILQNAAEPYQGTNWLLLRKIFNILQYKFNVNPNVSTFLDFGSGAGRVLIFALHKKYEHVVGVEFDKSLCKEAEKNIESYLKKCSLNYNQRWDIVNADASTYKILPDINVIFFYNPFREPVIGNVAANLLYYSMGKNKDIVIVYVNPVCLDAFVTRGFVPVVRLRNDVVFIVHPLSSYCTF